jgi:hypothetical protein
MNAITTAAPAHRASHVQGGQMLFGPRVEVPAAVTASVSIDDICELIDAAGPLTLRDIAGGLNAPLRQVSACVQAMVKRDWLNRDEFRRYRLCAELTPR